MIRNVRNRQSRGNYTKPQVKGSKLTKERLQRRIAESAFLWTRRILERLQAIEN
jgi:hypothetical protein